MIETLTLITLSILLLIYFRPGKTPPLDNPLVINRAGRYQATLAPKLNLAQPLIEAIAEQLVSANEARENSSTQIFEVYDKQVTGSGKKCYFLAISRRNGMLYFHATHSHPCAQNKHSASPVEADQRITAAAQKAAQQRGISINICE